MGNDKITPVILAGGAGTRLWPISRSQMPKQFCKLTTQDSLFQQTLRRFSNSSLFNPPMIVTSSAYLSLVQSQAHAIDVRLGKVICEEVGRNTGPAVALAALVPSSIGINDLLLIAPSDHMIGNTEAFLDTVFSGVELCRGIDDIVTIGIKPCGPETGYGYIRTGEPHPSFGCKVANFTEKPSLDAAKAMLAQGGYYWNSGIFLARRATFIREFENCCPDLIECVRGAIGRVACNGPVFTPEAKAYRSVPSVSFDCAVMEVTQNASVVISDPKWSDLGSFAAIHEQVSCNEQENVIHGDVVAHNARGCLAISTGPMIALSEVEDMVVVATKDAVLVTTREHAQSVKDVVREIETQKRIEAVSHPGEDRPWGRFDSVHRGDGHQVKCIRVNPGGRLSLQYHNYRAEHWVIVHGIATVTIGESIRDVSPGEHVFIPMGEVHRLENLTSNPVEIIEVQMGSYLGEDDIVRLEDIYDRQPTPQRALVA